MTASIEDVIDLTQAIRKDIRGLASSRRVGMELLSLGRFVGKVEGLVESLHELIQVGRGGPSDRRSARSSDVTQECSEEYVDGQRQDDVPSTPLLQSTSSVSQLLHGSPLPSEERPSADLDDIVEAVENVKEVVSFIERQGSVERLLLLEENRELLKVAASDLGYSITTFEPLLQWLPDDIGDDYWNIQKQLKELGFFADPDAVLAIQETLHGLVLHFCGYMSDDSIKELLSKTLLMIFYEEHPVWRASSTDQHDSERGNELQWMMDNSLSLYQAALMQKAGGDYSVHLQYLLMARGMNMLVWDLIRKSSDAGRALYERHQKHADEQSCILQEPGILQTRLERAIRLDAMCEDMILETIESSTFLITQQQIDEALEHVSESMHDIFEIVQDNSSETLVWTAQTANKMSCYISSTLVESETSSDRQERAMSFLLLASMIDYQASAQPEVLVESRMPEKVLQCLECSPTPATRAALLGACKTMFRDKSCRKLLQDHRAGLLILLRFLTSPVALVKRNAARALSNYCIQDEHLKILAHRMGATQSLLALVERGDVLGQEAATSTIANLAANCPSVQSEIGNSGNPFTILVRLIQIHVEKPVKRSSLVLRNAARAIQNLTGRVNLNRLKAVDAGAIPLLERLLLLDGIEPRSSASVALCNLTKCSFAQDVGISSTGISALLDVLADHQTPPVAKTGALFAAKHAVSRLNTSSATHSLASIELRDEHLEALVGFLEDARKEIKSSAASIIGTLCQCRTARVPKCFVRKGALNPLISMLENTETSRSARFALGAMSSNDQEIHGMIQKSVSAAEPSSQEDIYEISSKPGEGFQKTASNPTVIETW